MLHTLYYGHFFTLWAPERKLFGRKWRNSFPSLSPLLTQPGLVLIDQGERGEEGKRRERRREKERGEREEREREGERGKVSNRLP